MKMKKRFLGILFSLVMVLGLMPGMRLTAYADSEVKYLDASGTEQSITDYTVVDSSTTTFTQGWYVVNSDVEINQRVGISISGNANLILCDGAKLTVTSSMVGINAARGSLTIYAQSTSDNMGELEVTGTGTAGIRLQKNLTINGGKIETQGSNGIFSQDADITINGGNVTADGGIFFNTENNLTITGGKVIALVTGTGSGIDTDGEVIISGGNVSVTGDENPAIRGTVKNSIAGTGWTNKAGTEGKADIAISTGQTLSYKKVQFPAAASHTHNFAYSSDGATITATCYAEDCDLKDSKTTLTIVAPTMTVYQETGKSEVASLTGLQDFNTATGKSLAVTNIMYVGRDGTEYTESTTAPKNAGKYTATITLSGVKTAEGDGKSVAASVDYSIKYAVTFNTNGGSEVPQQLVEAGESATRPTDPTREGNIFGGWFADADFAESYVFDEVTENTTVYAKWGEHRVTWTVGRFSIQDVFTGNAPAADSNTTMNLAAETLKPEGATFEGWKTETDVSGDVTYTAQFSFPVTLNVNGGTINAGNVESYIYGTGATLPTDVTRAKYDFGGWFNNSGLTGTAVTQIGTTEVGSREFWAKWTEVYAVPATVTANNRTYDGTEKPLVTVTGTPTGGEMQYALGTATEATEQYTTSIPAKTDPGTYYVWYKVVGDANHNDTAPAYVEVEINSPYSKEWVDGKWYEKDGSQTYEWTASWERDGKEWMYVDESGWYPKNRWQKIDSKWYFFDQEGHMLKDAYQKDPDGNFYYLGKDGAWDEADAVIGWKQDSTGWWFGLYGKDYLKDTWKMINGNWYYFKSNGYIAMNEFVQGYWLNAAGAWKDPVHYGWHKSNGKYWYGVKDGWYAKNGTFIIDGESYTFDKNGYLK